MNKMNRKEFLRTLAITPLLFAGMKLNHLEEVTDQYSNTEKMPLLFIGHGHPMNALFDNQFTQRLQKIGAEIPKPNAIMVVSAHWETQGSFVSTNPHPKTIYDFGNFDERLFEIKYEPLGHPVLASEINKLAPIVQEESRMGLDHGAWTVLKHIYPLADVPVFQLSIDYTKGPAYHFELAGALRKMREKGVLILGSGNIVHNLRLLDWYHIDGATPDWALEFDTLVKDRLDQHDYKSLVHYEQMGKSAQIAVPSNDHYLPLLYTLGMADEKEEVKYLYEGFQYGSISMRCLMLG